MGKTNCCGLTLAKFIRGFWNHEIGCMQFLLLHGSNHVKGHARLNTASHYTIPYLSKLYLGLSGPRLQSLYPSLPPSSPGVALPVGPLFPLGWHGEGFQGGVKGAGLMVGGGCGNRWPNLTLQWCHKCYRALWYSSKNKQTNKQSNEAFWNRLRMNSNRFICMSYITVNSWCSYLLTVSIAHFCLRLLLCYID